MEEVIPELLAIGMPPDQVKLVVPSLIAVMSLELVPIGV
jgi:hypothetical protein